MNMKDLLAPFAVWKRVFEKPYTIRKPIDERPGAPRYRGFHKNDMDACIGCGTCEAICQNQAIDLVALAEPVNGNSGLRPKIDYGRCCWCALCVDICPTGSLTMSNHYIWVDSDPEAFRFIPGHDEKPWNASEEGYHRQSDYRLLEPERVGMPALSGEESVVSFIEMVKGFSKEQAMKEADRCVECGICIASCPAHMDIPGYIRAIREDDMGEALRLLYESNPFPAACGRVCTHHCEEVCAVGHSGDPVSIRWLKRYIADQIELPGYAEHLPSREVSTGKRVAVLGAGPGGLAAAYYLGMMGHEVTVFEASPKAGGMLRYGIPEYRLPYEQLDKDISHILSVGVHLRCGTKVGKDIGFHELMGTFDACFISPGLSLPYSIGIAGEEDTWVVSGLDILRKVTDGLDPEVGKRVAVVGGGNVAMDAARTCRRLGAEVTVLYRRREEDMPADPEEIREAKEEGVIFVYQAIPLRIEPAEGGKAAFVWGGARMVDQGPGKRPAPELIEGDEHVETVDTVVSAIGQGGDFSFLPSEQECGIILERGRITADADGRTGNPKVFVGGDIANRKKDAVSAIADGHRAAIAIDRFLNTSGS